MHRIHPTALVDSSAELGPDVEVGPFVVVEKGVQVGARTRLMARAYLCTGTTMGEDCVVHIGAVIGHEPQDLSYQGEPTTTIVGNGCTIREHVTIHRATVKDPNPTTIGARCFLMAGSHVAHNCVIGEGVTLANGALLAGHVHVGDRSIVSGNTVIHQFVRVGRLTMLSGGSRFGMDVPPYLIGDGANTITVLNSVGLRRAPGLTDDDRAQVKAAYKILYRSDLDLKDALARLKAEFTSPAVAHWVEFYRAPTKRGFCPYRRVRRVGSSGGASE